MTYLKCKYFIIEHIIYCISMQYNYSAYIIIVIALFNTH